MYKTVETLVTCRGETSREYPIALRDARAVLVSERAHVLPHYACDTPIHSGTADAADADQDSFDHGQLRERNRPLFQSLRTPSNLISGLHEWGSDNPIVVASIISHDQSSAEPAVTTAQVPGFSYLITPKSFDLGLTGRLLQDESGKHYAERLRVETTIYDAFDLAIDAGARTVVAVMADGTRRAVLVPDGLVGETENIRKRRDAQTYVFHERELCHWNHMPGLEVLTVPGFVPVEPAFCSAVQQYAGAILFGHSYAGLEVFLAVASMADGHILWDIGLMGGANPVLTEWGRQVESAHPELKNRLQLEQAPISCS